MEFQKHDVTWTDEKIKNFWGYFVENKGLLELSFAQEAGREILKIAKPFLNPHGENLDYGCGGGSLMEYLFENGISCAGLDSSPESLEIVKKNFSGNPLYKGVVLATVPPYDIKEGTYDFIFCVETVEHLFWDRLPSVFSEMYRMLKPGGYVFITTPFKENLDKYKVICPDCGASFHRVQHMNTFSIESLSNLMEGAGFKTIECKNTLFQKGKSLFHQVKYVVNKVVSQIMGKKVFAPHLYYIGRKQ